MAEEAQDCRKFEDDNTVMLWLLSDDQKTISTVLKCLYNLYAPACMRWLIYSAGGKLSGQTAEHHAVEAFNESLRAIHDLVRQNGFVPDGRPNASRRYLYQVSHNAYCRIRKRVARDLKIFSAAGVPEEYPEPVLVPAMETKDEVRKVLELIDTMHEKCREIIRLKFIECYKVSEIAQQMDMDREQVSKRLHRCREKFQELLSLYLINRN